MYPSAKSQASTSNLSNYPTTADNAAQQQYSPYTEQKPYIPVNYGQLPQSVQMTELGEPYTVYHAPDGTLIDGRTVDVSAMWYPQTANQQQYFAGPDGQRYPMNYNQREGYYQNYNYPGYQRDSSFSTDEAVKFDYDKVQKSVRDSTADVPNNTMKRDIYHRYPYSKCIKVNYGTDIYYVIPFGEVIDTNITPNTIYQIFVELISRFPADYDEENRKIWPSYYVNPLVVLENFVYTHTPHLDGWKTAIEHMKEKQNAGPSKHNYTDYRDSNYVAANSMDSVEMRTDFLAETDDDINKWTQSSSNNLHTNIGSMRPSIGANLADKLTSLSNNQLTNEKMESDGNRNVSVQPLVIIICNSKSLDKRQSIRR